MQIIVLGKTGCKKCEACKEKLNLLGKNFRYIAIDDPETWRTNGAVSAVAEAAYAGLDFTHPPIVVIDRKAYTYSEAMRVLKKGTNNED